MYRNHIWIAIFLCVIAAGCRTFPGLGRAAGSVGRVDVRLDRSAPKPPNISPTGASSNSAEGYWQSSDAAVHQTAASEIESVPTATNESRATWGRPDLASIYRRTSQIENSQRNPIIVIPGILGSKLVDESGQRVVWGEFGGNGIDPALPDGARLLGIPMEERAPLEDLVDSVQVAGPLDALNIRVFGVPFQVTAYREILVALGVGGYHDASANAGHSDSAHEVSNCFQFAYDWRRDNVETAAKLHEFILEKKALVEAERRRQFGNNARPVRFDIVAHSMGGVMARYYLQYGNTPLPTDGSLPKLTWAGAENIERLVMVAPPNAGSLQAVEYLTQGVQFSRFFSKYEPAVLGTMPSTYQLLPRTRHRPVVGGPKRQAIDLLDPKNWVQARWGFFNPNQAEVLRQLLPDESDPQRRLQIAYDHLCKCLRNAERFHEAIDVESVPPKGTTLHLIASDAHPTLFQYAIDSRGVLTPTAKVAGDGMVTRHSALMDERLADQVNWAPRVQSPIKWESVNFIFTDHLGLTKDPAFTDNVLYLLLEAPR